MDSRMGMLATVIIAGAGGTHSGVLLASRSEKLSRPPVLETRAWVVANNQKSARKPRAESCDARGLVEADLALAAVENRGDRQAAFFEANTQAVRDVEVMLSFAVYESDGRSVIPPARTARSPVSAGDGIAHRFEMPEGLPDGHYYAELLTASAPPGAVGAVVGAQREHFRIVAGDIEPMTTSDWSRESGVEDDVEVIEESQTEVRR